MNLFRTLPNQNFLLTLTEFILENFSSNLDRVKVIVPTGFLANNLQKIIIQKCNISILPDIVSYPKIITSGEEMFKIPSETLQSLSYLEEKIILAEIIQNYEKLKYNKLQSLKFAPLLANLFNQLILNNIDIKKIRELPTLSSAEHWKFIYEFLYFAYEEWQKKIQSLNKTSKSEYLIAMLNAEKERLNDEDYFIIAAGFFGHDHTSWNFLKNIASHKNGFVFLPPVPESLEDDIPDSLDNFYCLYKFLSIIEKKITDFKIFGNPDKRMHANVLDKLILQQKPHKTNDTIVKSVDVDTWSEERTPMNTRRVTSDGESFDYKLEQNLSNIKYIECQDVFEEAELISSICKNHPDEKIALVVTNNRCKNFYKVFLQKYGLQFNDQLGADILNSNICQLIITFSELVCNEFSLKNLFIFLKNPIAFVPNVIKLEQLLLGKNRFIENIKQINQIVTSSNDSELINWWKEQITSISNINDLFIKNDDHSSDFKVILRMIISNIDNLFPAIWEAEEYYASEVSAFFSELLESNIKPSCSCPNEFPVILKSILSGAKKYDIINDSYNIYICMAQDAALIKFDIVILTDFSAGSWPPEEEINPWLNRQMQETLEFYPELLKNFSYLYHFYLLMYTPSIFITRSKRQGSSILLTSNYMRILAHILPIITQHVNIINSTTNSYTRETFESIDYSFPSQISATDIEMLVRNPYSFYVKKILKLKKIESINKPAGILEYGNYLHTLIDRYSKNYNIDQYDKKNKLLELSSNILSDTLLPTNIRKAWYIKTKALAHEFIFFDENRRKNSNVYSEVRGKMVIDILGHNLEIIGIADRIEIDTNGNFTILDFKTGSIPSLKDVHSGLSPQLIILALIAIKNGFDLKLNNINSLSYVKLASSKPYVQIVDLSITMEDLNRHKSGIIALLEYYIKTMDFTSEVDLLKYNDYKHFARIIT